jgi:isoquinoline 1-oxidoreductase subunit alpha
VPSYSFKLNGENIKVDAPADMPLLWVLRDLLGVTGPKYGCGVGVCRACTCHVNGSAVQVCQLTAADVVGKRTWPNAASVSPGRSCRPRRC